MNEIPPKKDPDLRPLTVEHGRKLFAKSEDISQQVSRLMPLLSLMEMAPVEEGADPIQAIVRLLEALSVHGHQLSAALQEIEGKIDLLLANPNINFP